MFEERYRWHRFYSSEEALKERIPYLKTVPFQVAGHRVCVTHTKLGIRAVKDKCPHQGAALSNGWCTEDGNVVCPWHRYEFSLENGRGAGTYVEVYPLEVRDDGVYIGFPYMAFTLFAGRKRKKG